MLYLKSDKFLTKFNKAILHENTLYVGENVYGLLKDANEEEVDLLFEQIKIINLNRIKEKHKELFKK